MAAVEHLILDGAAFVMEDGELAGSGFFVFITEGEFSFTYFVTATHVVWNDWRKRNAKFPPDDEVTIRLNRLRGGTMDIPLKKSEWIYHDDRRFVDLCAVYLSEPEHKYLSEGNAGVINIENLAASAENKDLRIPSMEIMLGDEVFITGAFWPRLGKKKNIPIVRTGNIAALCEEPIEFFSPRQAAYLVETRSLGGISGSPVWFDPNTRHGRIGRSWGPAVTTNTQTGKSSEPTVIVPYRFVGMVIGTWHTDAKTDFVQRKRRKTIDADWNTGISVVIPDFRILEFLMSPRLKEQRIQATEEREKNSGARFTSAQRRDEQSEC